MSSLDADGHASPTSTAFIVEQAVGAAGLGAVLATVIWSGRIQRSATWFNVYFSFMILAMSYLMLAVFGQAYGPQPDYTLCVFQASLLYAADPLVAATLLSLCIELWMGLTLSLTSTAPIKVKLALVIAPYVLWTAILFESFLIGITTSSGGVFGLTNSLGVSRQPDHPYCTIKNAIPGRASQAIIALIGVAALVLLGLSMHRLWVIRRRGGDMSHPIRRNAYDIFCRMSCFSLGGLVGVGVCIAFLKSGQVNAAVDPLILLIGSFPLVGAIILGSRKEILEAWLSPFRRTTSQEESEVELVRTKRWSVEKV